MIADILNGPRDDLNGPFDIINASAFFHLFAWDDQVVASIHLAHLLQARPGVMIVGRRWRMSYQAMSLLSVKGVSHRHNVESLQRLWDIAGE